MLRINLRPQVKVVEPYGKLGFGRYVVGNREITRLRILKQSLVTVRCFLENTIPDLYESEREGRVKEFIEEFRRRDMLELPKIEHPESEKDLSWESVHRRISTLNNICRDKKINGRFIEFVLADLPGLPQSMVRIIPRHEPIDYETEKKFLNERPTGAFFYLAGKGVIKNRTYKQSELYEIFCNNLGGISREIMNSFLTDNYIFRRFMRPRRLQNKEPLYFVSGTGFKTISRKIAPVALPERGSFVHQFTVLLRAEADELIQEGRIIPVHYGRKHPVYFSPEALKEWLEDGRIVELAGEDGPKYVEVGKVANYLKKGDKIKIHRPSAAQVFLNYLRDHSLDDQAARTYPLLAIAIEVMRSTPQGTDPYFEAAAIAAKKGASEESLTALLMRKSLVDSNACNQTYSEVEQIFGNYYELVNYRLGGDLLHYFERKGQVWSLIHSLEEALACDVGAVNITEEAEIISHLKHLVGRLKNEATRLNYFATVLGRLRFCKTGGLSKRELENLRVMVAPMAERFGFSDIAAEIRNEIFRISYHRDFAKMKRFIEQATGMNYHELGLHLEDMAQLVKQVLEKAGFDPTKTNIQFRAKLPYSAWEKMRACRIDNPGQLYDLLGINVVLSGDRELYQVVDLLEQIFPAISRHNFKDQHGLLAYLRRDKVPLFKDQILKPAPSGFSALTTRRLTTLDLPLEIQLTTFARHEVNSKGVAAHWQHKLRREIKTFYGLDIDEIKLVD
jgi:hypothetical protein